MKKALLPIIVLALIFSACQKPVWVRSDTLERHKWQMVSYSENGQFLTVPECEKEETYSFYNTGLGYVIAGEVRCDTSKAVIDTVINYGWSVDGDQYNLFLTHFGNYDYNPVWNFVKFSETSFEVRGIDTRNDSTITYDRIFNAIN